MAENKRKPKPKAATRKKLPRRGVKGAARSGHGEIKKWFLRTLANAGGEIAWGRLLSKFGKKYPGKQTAVLYSYFKSGIATRLKNGNVRLSRKGKSLLEK